MVPVTTAGNPNNPSVRGPDNPNIRGPDNPNIRGPNIRNVDEDGEVLMVADRYLVQESCEYPGEWIIVDTDVRDWAFLGEDDMRSSFVGFASQDAALRAVKGLVNW